MIGSPLQWGPIFFCKKMRGPGNALESFGIDGKGKGKNELQRKKRYDKGVLNCLFWEPVAARRPVFGFSGHIMWGKKQLLPETAYLCLLFLIHEYFKTDLCPR
jgi:hypothetical protein